MTSALARSDIGVALSRPVGAAVAAVALALLSAALPPSQTAIALAVMAASALSSVAGFAFSALCGALLFHLSGDKTHLVQVMMTCSIANQATMTWSVRHHVTPQPLIRSLAGGLLGLPIGVYLLLHSDPRAYVTAIGALLVGYGALMLLRRPIVIANPPWIIDFVAGFVGGIMGGAVALPSALVAIWTGMKGWSKERQRGVFQPFILVMQLAGLALVTAASPRGGGFRVGDPLLFVPFSLFGNWAGMLVFGRLSDRQFSRVLNVLLIVSGASYLP